MIKFPILEESSFINVRTQFHSIAKVIGKFRETLVKPIAKNDNLFLQVVEQGFCTPPINQYKELEIGCNPVKQIIEIANNEGKYKSFSIIGQSQNSLGGEIAAVLEKEFSINVEIDKSVFDSNKTFDITESDAGDFLNQLVSFNSLLHGFYKRIAGGVKTQIYLWPHHFDNAFKWFSGRKLDDSDEQMGIGVSNGDETHELPYVYMTFWPPLRKTNTLEIAEGAILHDSGWTGFVLPYESILERSSPVEQANTIDNYLDVSFASVQRAFSKR